MTDPENRQGPAALVALIVLQVVMLGSLYTKTLPHPPEVVAPFAIAPFLGVSLAIAAAALVLGACETIAARGFSIMAALSALVSFGPQKYFDAQFELIWPAVIAGQIAVILLCMAVWGGRNAARTQTS